MDVMVELAAKEGARSVSRLAKNSRGLPMSEAAEKQRVRDSTGQGVAFERERERAGWLGQLALSRVAGQNGACLTRRHSPWLVGQWRKGEERLT